MVVLPGVLSFPPLRNNIQVGLGTNPAVPGVPRGCQVARSSNSRPLRSAHYRTASGICGKRHLRQAGSQFRGLATAIHGISGLALDI